MNQQYTPPPIDVTPDDRLWAALAYFFSPLVPVILMLWDQKKNRPFIKANNMQALVTGIVAWVIIWIINAFTLCIGSVLWLVMLYPAYQAYQGKVPEIPFISNFIRQQGW